MEEIRQTGADAGELVETGIAMMMAYLPKVLLALLTLLIGLWLIGRIVRLLDSKLRSRDPTLTSFVCGVIGIILKVMLLISVASMIGVATTSFIAVIGAAGLAIGLALQGSLANFAGGVLILSFKPFKVGDTVEAEGHLGAITEIQILYTVMTTFDNRRVIIPNGALSNATLVNVNVNDTRRCDLEFGIHYDNDIDVAKTIIQGILSQDSRTLIDPPPRIAVGSLGDNSVNIIVRPWVKTDDLWPYYWDMQETIKKAFDKGGITIPYPQRDVHLYSKS